MGVLTTVQINYNIEKKEKKGVGRIASCFHPQFSHFYHAKSMTIKIR